MRRDYGSRLFELLDSPLTEGPLALFSAATAEALSKWEPRFLFEALSFADSTPSAGAPAFTRDGRRVWLRFSDDGTDITVQWSISGVYWHTLYSGAKASSHLGSEGYNRLFFGASSNSITGVATLLSWSIS